MTELSKYKTFLPVVEARAVSDHEVGVRFADGSAARVDFSDLMTQRPWRKLSDPGFFKLAHAAYDTVIWTDDVDVAPEEVWARAQMA